MDKITDVILKVAPSPRPSWKKILRVRAILFFVKSFNFKNWHCWDGGRNFYKIFFLSLLLKKTVRGSVGQVLKTVGQISIPGPMGYPRGSYSNYLMHVPGLNLASAIARPGLVALVPFYALPGRHV